LLRAHRIVNLRSEEQERRHGPFSVGMEKTAVVASILTGKELTAVDCYKILMALKISRIANSIELDSMTDLCGYVEGLWNYKNKT
jgi:adenylosuccinate synthase